MSPTVHGCIAEVEREALHHGLGASPSDSEFLLLPELAAALIAVAFLAATIRRTAVTAASHHLE